MAVTRRGGGGARPLLVPLCGLATVLLGAWGAWQWSLVPVALDGHIESVGYHSESGYRWRDLQLDDGRSLVVDRQVADDPGTWAQLVGRPVHKDRFDRTLEVGGRRIGLGPSWELDKVVATLAGIAAFAVLRSRRTGRGSTGGGA